MSGRNGQVIGYVRVSTVDQNEARQVAAIGVVDRTYTDRASGKNTDRPQLQMLLSYARDGDTVRVQSPHRLARSTTDLLGLIETLGEKGVDVEFTDNSGLNTNSPQGTFFLTVLGALAQLERATTRERQAQGIALAKERGVYDRGPKLSAKQITDARARISGLGVPLARVARELGVSRQTLYTALKGEGRYQTN